MSKEYREMIHTGPDHNDPLWRQLIAFWLWWKLWALMILVGGAMLLGGYLTQQYGPAGGMFAVGIGYWLGELLDKLDL